MTEQLPLRESDARQLVPQNREPANLADILERVLDKGIVIAGDIRVSLLDIELLTLRIRLIVVSLDKAKEMGIDWWEYDPSLSAGRHHELTEENRRLRKRIDSLESRRSGDGELENEAPRRRKAPARRERPHD